ncbi:MAG: hypothetical protein WCF04_02315 [Candidatus Nanopelagicales bacterium]
MRKRIITSTPAEGQSADAWLDLSDVAEVEITSEDPEHPIEHALLPSAGAGWRAAGPGRQTIRLVFPDPQPIRRIRLEFTEPETERTQEFVLGWSSSREHPVAEIVRQQWNFSPGGGISETEDLRVDLQAVAVLELTITPDVSGGEARATLARLRLA